MSSTTSDQDPFADVPQGRQGIFHPGESLGEGNRYLVCKTTMGGFGEVLFVKDREADMRPRVVKVIPSGDDQAIEELKVMLRAARGSHLVSRVWHAGGGEVEGKAFFYLLMPFYSEGTLRSLMRHGPYPRPRHLLEIAWAMTWLNRKLPGFVHLDLKPENVFLSREVEDERGHLWFLESPRAVVGDFGLSRLAGDSVPARGFSPGYASPEQLIGAQVDSRSDMFSFGAMAYEYISGTRPFEEGGADDTRRMDLVAAASTLVATGVPESVVSTVCWCLRPDPAERPASWDELMSALEAPYAFVRERAASSRGGGPSTRLVWVGSDGRPAGQHPDGRDPLPFVTIDEFFRQHGVDPHEARAPFIAVASDVLFDEYGLPHHVDRFLGAERLDAAAVQSATHHLNDVIPGYQERRYAEELENTVRARDWEGSADEVLRYFGDPFEAGTKAFKIFETEGLEPILDSFCFRILNTGCCALALACWRPLSPQFVDVLYRGGADAYAPLARELSRVRLAVRSGRLPQSASAEVDRIAPRSIQLLQISLPFHHLVEILKDDLPRIPVGSFGESVMSASVQLLALGRDTQESVEHNNARWTSFLLGAPHFMISTVTYLIPLHLVGLRATVPCAWTDGAKMGVHRYAGELLVISRIWLEQLKAMGDVLPASVRQSVDELSQQLAVLTGLCDVFLRD